LNQPKLACVLPIYRHKKLTPCMVIRNGGSRERERRGNTWCGCNRGKYDALETRIGKSWVYEY
jgi:hypothetical protein